MKPEITVFAGPNGSGKSTITEILKPAYLYSNADDYQRVTNCTAIDAAIFVEKQRCGLIKELKNFCFETVLSTERYLNMLRYAKNHGYFIKAYFVLTMHILIGLRIKRLIFRLLIAAVHYVVQALRISDRS